MLSGSEGGDACLGCEQHLVHDGLGGLRVLLKVVGEGLAYGLIDSACHFAVAEFGFGLSFKLGFGHLDADYGGEAFAEVFAAYFYFVLGYGFGGGVLGILFQHAGKGCAEAGVVGTALVGVDVIDVGLYFFLEGGVVGQGHLDGDAGFLRLNVDDVGNEGVRPSCSSM